jgi:hypothetical protein
MINILNKLDLFEATEPGSRVHTLGKLQSDQTLLVIEAD